MRRALWLLVPFVALGVVHLAWDSIEIWRWNRMVAAIRGTGEPVVTSDLGPRHVALDAGDASRYYLSAADLVVTETTRPPVQNIDRLLVLNGPMFEMLREATARPFSGFPSGSEYSARQSRFLDLQRINSLRTRERLARGETTAAIDSLRDGWSMLRVQAAQPSPFGVQSQLNLLSRLVAEVKSVLETPHLSDGDLRRLQESVAMVRHDDLLLASALAARARFIEDDARRVLERRTRPLIFRRWRSRFDPVGFVSRPWIRRQVNAALAELNEFVEAARAPWPEKVRSGYRIRWEYPRPAGALTESAWLRLRRLIDAQRAMAADVVVVVAATYSLEGALAALRFQRAQGALPSDLTEAEAFVGRASIDPFSGRPLKYRITPGGFVVYSVGPNGLDDGGAGLDSVDRFGRPARSALDIGTRLTVAPSR